MTRGTDLIAAERQRQIADEGYDAEHDRGHADELAMAGATYAIPEMDRDYSFGSITSSPNTWPWGDAAWKPTPDDRIRELVKGGALIVAAIDSLLDARDAGA